MTTASTLGGATLVRQLKDLPGPRPWPVVGNALQLDRSRIHLDIERWAERYGEAFRMRLGKREVLVVSSHEVISNAMRDRPEGFRRPSGLARIIGELGMAPGLFVAEGEHWHRQRRMVMAAFSPTHIRAYFPQLKRVAERFRGRLDKAVASGQAVPLQADLMRFTVDVITGLAFGQETNTIEAEGDILQQHMDRIFPMLFKRLNSIFPVWHYVKTEEDRVLERSVHEVVQAIEHFMREARARLAADPARRAQPPNLIEALIVASEAPDSGMSEDDVVGNVFTMLLAGEDTTANTMAWLLDLLWRQPQALRKAVDEARRVVLPFEALTMDAVGELHYLDACINEAMRLKPVAPFRMLEALKPQVVAGVQIEAGTMVWCVSRHDSLSNDCFEAAREFRPERWLEDDTAAQQGQASVKRVSIPFGAGPRVCPGRYLAMVEMKLCLGMLLAHFDIEAIDTPDGQAAREVMNFTMTPEGQRLRLRRAAGV